MIAARRRPSQVSKARSQIKHLMNQHAVSPAARGKPGKTLRKLRKRYLSSLVVLLVAYDSVCVEGSKYSMHCGNIRSPRRQFASMTLTVVKKRAQVAATGTAPNLNYKAEGRRGGWEDKGYRF